MYIYIYIHDTVHSSTFSPKRGFTTVNPQQNSGFTEHSGHRKSKGSAMGTDADGISDVDDELDVDDSMALMFYDLLIYQYAL